MNTTDFPPSFWTPSRESLPPTEDNSIADPYPPRNDRFAQNIPPEFNGKIPTGSRLRRESSVRCEIARSGMEYYAYQVEILENLCEKWAYYLNCTKTTKVYWWRGGDVWTQIDEWVEVYGGKHFVILCPGGTLWDSDEEPYVPQLPDIPERIRVQQAVGIREDGQAYELDSVVTWQLGYPLVKTGPCTGKATWKLIKRTQKFRMPEHAPVTDPATKRVITPTTEVLRTETVDYRIPDCPQTTRAGDVSTSPDAAIAQVPLSPGRLGRPGAAAGLSDRERVGGGVDTMVDYLRLGRTPLLPGGVAIEPAKGFKSRIFRAPDGTIYLHAPPRGAFPVEPLRCFIREDGTIMSPDGRTVGRVKPLPTLGPDTARAAYDAPPPGETPLT